MIWVRGDPADLVETVPYFESGAPSCPGATGDDIPAGLGVADGGEILVELGRIEDNSDLAQAVEVFAGQRLVGTTGCHFGPAALAIALGDLDAALRLDGATSTLSDSSGAKSSTSAATRGRRWMR